MYDRTTNSERSISGLVFYVGLGIIGLALVISIIIGSVSIHYNYETRITCIKEGETVNRLPSTSVIPLEYTVSLKPDLKTFNYSGAVDITVEVHNETRCMVLNAEDLNFGRNDVTLYDLATGKKVKLIDFNLDTTYHKLYLKFDRTFKIGEKLKLSIVFKAALRDDLRGFYKSTYTRNGVTKVIATTQFESEAARTAFPCWDAPNFKAKFTISITLRPEDAGNDQLRVLSNMPEAGRTALQDGSSIVRFQESPLMSTYLVAFIIGEFDYVEATQDDILIRVYSLPGDGEKGKFQLSVACKVTNFFNEYFGVKYALPKMDLIGIPDFRAGAMENWGLITFRANYLIVDNTTTQSQIESGAEVVAHEIAHQWTGNFITCKWWSHLWLNEGFATFFETLSLDHAHPEFNRWQAKLTNSIQYAFIADALPSSHAVVNKADSPSEIEEIFDNITYDKGGSVLYMIYHAIGAEKFQSWMRAYFAKYQYTNTETSQLLQVLESVKDVGVSAAQVATWTNNPGFPVVTVSASGNGKYSIEQKRFYAHTPANGTTSSSSSDPVWWIPITVLSSNGQVQNIQLNERSMNNAITISSGKWIKLNYKQNAFYRVNYPTELWLALFEQIGAQSDLLSVGDRFGIVDDIFALSFAGDLTVTAALKLVPHLKSEATFVIWDTVLSYLDRISSLISKEPINGNFKRFIIDLVEERFEKIGWDRKESDGNDEIKLRPLLLSAVTRYGYQSAKIEAINRFNKFIQDEQANNIEPDIRQTIYKTVVSELGEEGYYQMLNRLVDATNRSDFNEANRCMYALAWTRDPALVKNTLELSLSPTIRSQDTVFLIREVSRNPYGTDITWDFVREYYSLIVDKAGQRTVSSRLITATTARFTTRTKHDEVLSFFKDRDNTQYVNEALETILVNEQFLKKNYNELKAYLQAEFPFKKEDN